MTTSAFLSVLGLVLSLIGVVILFRYGMPYRVETGGAIPLAIEGEDEAAKATERKYRTLGWIGLGMIILGTALQIAGVVNPSW